MPKKFVVCVLLSLLVLPGLALGQQSRIAEILQSPRQFKDEVVELEGFVIQYQEGDAKSTSFYLLKDDWGSIIKVRTSYPRPEVNKRYRVKGPVDIDVFANEPYVSEESRSDVVRAEGVSRVDRAVSTESLWTKYRNQILIVAIVFVFIAIVFLISTMLKKRAPVEVESGKLPLIEPLAPAGPAPEEMLEGKTVKMAVPPAGTLKLLPGRFIVVSGEDKVKELRFYRTKAQDENEVTFGRASGSAYNYVQLKSMTVSAKQSKLLYAGGKFTIINYSSTNPTKVNGQELEVNGTTVLNDGDRVEMGEVTFEFRTA